MASRARPDQPHLQQAGTSSAHQQSEVKQWGAEVQVRSVQVPLVEISMQDTAHTHDWVQLQSMGCMSNCIKIRSNFQMAKTKVATNLASQSWSWRLLISPTITDWDAAVCSVNYKEILIPAWLICKLSALSCLHIYQRWLCERRTLQCLFTNRKRITERQVCHY